MDTPDFSPTPSGSTDARPADMAELQQSLATLRLILVAMLAILALGALGANVFLVRKVGDARRQSEELERRVVPMSTQFENTLKPRISAFLNALYNFSKSNPDFAPILQKYPISAAPGAQPPAAAQAPGATAPPPAPAAPPAPKQ